MVLRWQSPTETCGRKAGPAELTISHMPCRSQSWAGPGQTWAAASSVPAVRLRVDCSAMPPFERTMLPTATAKAALLHLAWTLVLADLTNPMKFAGKVVGKADRKLTVKSKPLRKV